MTAESYYVGLLNGSVTDGVIVVAPSATNFATNAPLVAIDPNNESPECPAIISTNHEGALQAMEYIVGLGHRRIGFITGREELVSSSRRLQGYRDGLVEAGIPVDEESHSDWQLSSQMRLLSVRAGCCRWLIHRQQFLQPMISQRWVFTRL